MKLRYAAAAACLGLVALTACGGSSGGGTAASPTSSSPSAAPTFVTPTDTTEPPPPPTPRTEGLPVGRSAVVSQDGFDDQGDQLTTVERVTVNSITLSRGSADGFETPAPGKVFLVGNVTIDCVRGPCVVNPLYFRLQTPDGTGLESNAAATPDPGLDSQTLNPGGRIRGNVGVETPTPKGAWQLLSVGDSSVLASWAVSP